MIAELLASTLIKAAAEQAEGWEAAIGAAAGWAPEREPNSSAGLPPPMIPGNADVPTSLCAIQVGRGEEQTDAWVAGWLERRR